LMEIELGDLEKAGREISQILEKKFRMEIVVKGSKLIVSEKSNDLRFGAKEVKMQLKHALHHLGLSDEFRVLVERTKIRIVRVEEKPRPAPERKSTVPPPSKSLPYFFP